jgi:hypothetical protein
MAYTTIRQGSAMLGLAIEFKGTLVIALSCDDWYKLLGIRERFLAI